MPDSAAHPIVVIGAGAAGLMAAIHAAAGARPIVLLERTPDGGRKILISGGGRCNVLPSLHQPERFVSDSSPHLVKRLLGAWPLEEQRGFFERALGIPLQHEPETGKLFPASNRARDVRDALVREARRRGVIWLGEHRATAVRPASGSWQVELEGRAPITAAAVVVATGGLSVPATGSDGFGLTLAGQTDHAIRPTYPALTPLTAEPPVHASLAGISLDVTLEASVGRRRLRASGGFLFTHRGYSGPAVLDLSHLAVRSRAGGSERQAIRVCWTGVDESEWEARLQPLGAREVLTAVREVLPARLAEWLLADAGIEPERRLAQLRREERRALIERLVRYALPWSGDEGYKKAEVTGGGVALEELHPSTLESRRHPGLYFCGEVLDAFGPIGGYNFAWAWSTGRTAGMAAGSK